MAIVSDLLHRGDLKVASTAAREREDLLAHVLGVERAWLFAHPEARVHPARVARFRRLVARFHRDEPLAQILGEQWFYGRPFRVTRDVLIPRPETELLVELAVRQASVPLFHDRGKWGGLTIIDIGTGSGCIAVTLAAELPHARVIATDISPTALRIARLNARRNGVANRITFLRGNLLKPIQTPRENKKQQYTVLDGRPKLCTSDSVIVVANLPYLTANEWRALPHFALQASRGKPHFALPTPLKLRGARRASLLRSEASEGHARGKPRSLRTYEPRTAFDGGSDGLTPYRILFAQLRNVSQISPPKADAPQAQNLKFQILLEIDPRRRTALARLTRRMLPTWHATFHRDLAERWRVLELQP